MTAQLIAFAPAFNAASMIAALRLAPGTGLHEIIHDRLTEAVDQIKTDKDLDMRQRGIVLQGLVDGFRDTLDDLRYFAGGYFANDTVPSSVACAVLAAMGGISPHADAPDWKHKDARAGHKLLMRFDDFETRVSENPDLTQESNPEWRELIFLRQFLLNRELKMACEQLESHPPQVAADPLDHHAYWQATQITWPASRLSVSNAVFASKIRNILTNPAEARKRLSLRPR